MRVWGWVAVAVGLVAASRAFVLAAPQASPEPAPHATIFAVPHGLVVASPDTIRLSPEESLPRPTVEYPSLDATRDSVEAMLRRGIAADNPEVRISRETIRFGYRFVADSTTGLSVHVVVADTSSCPVEFLEAALAAAGWAPTYDYSADGPDGTVMGYVTGRYLCIVEGRWDGGDDSDSTYVPDPGCEVTATCVPRRPDDVPAR